MVKYVRILTAPATQGDTSCSLRPHLDWPSSSPPPRARWLQPNPKPSRRARMCITLAALMSAPTRIPTSVLNCGGTGTGGTELAAIARSLGPAFGPAASNTCSTKKKLATESQTKGFDIVKQLFGAVTLGLAVMSGIINASASVPLPIVEQVSGTRSLAPLLKQITPAVAGISIKGGTTSAKNSAPIKGRRAQRSASVRDLAPDHQMRASGSGVVIDAGEGIILTNTHVIDGAEEIIVTFPDGRELQAKRVGSDAVTDVAVIRVQADALPAIPIGNSDQLEVGDFVLAIGNPFQIGQTVTSGIVSGLHRNNVGIEQYEDFIQTDAAIYPGNSGGALVNLRGELIGINTAFLGVGNTNPGMGFAIPINMVRSVADQLLKYGEVRRGRLGITFNEPTPALIRNLKLSASTASPVIVKVDKGSPAEAAGLRVGDVVSEFAGTSVRDTADLHNRMALLSAGAVADLTVVRRGKPMVIRATIADQEKAIRSK